MALSADTPRTFIEVLNGGVVVEPLAEESQTFYRGAAVGLDATDQNVQPLEDGDVFLGICLENKTIGATGGVETVKVQVGGVVKLPVTSVAKANIGAGVYATDDGTFILTSTGNASIGRVIHVPATGTAWVMLKMPGEALLTTSTTAANVT
jgi:predicted RecA/RadA family phage recombinase